MKVLNVDALVKEERGLTLNGVTYEVISLPVGDFISLTQEGEDLKKLKLAGEDVTAKETDVWVRSISKCVPSCPIEEIRKRGFAELGVIYNFVTTGMLPNDMKEELLKGDSKKKPTRRKAK